MINYIPTEVNIVISHFCLNVYISAKRQKLSVSATSLTLSGVKIVKPTDLQNRSVNVDVISTPLLIKILFLEFASSRHLD